MSLEMWIFKFVLNYLIKNKNVTKNLKNLPATRKLRYIFTAVTPEQSKQWSELNVTQAGNIKSFKDCDVR